MPEVLEQLLDHVQDDRGVGRVASPHRRATRRVGTAVAFEPIEAAGHDNAHRGNTFVQCGQRRDGRELRVAITLARIPQRHVAEPVLGDAAAVHDERSDRRGVRAAPA